MGALADVWSEVCSTLAGAGLTVTADPATVRPGVTLVDPPRIVAGRSASISDVELEATVCGLPPGKVDAMNNLLDVCDTIVATYPTTTTRMGVYTSNGQDLPAFVATIRLTIQR